MPFTFSHPAAVIPAKYLPKKWVSMTALIAGSMTPDFEYFIRMRNLSLYSHTWTGLFWFDLPLAFALTYVFHVFIRDSFIAHLPKLFRKRLNFLKGFDWHNYVKYHFITVVLCLMIGIATHIAWDGFTHRTGCFVPYIPWLKQSTIVSGYGLSNYYIMQTISSIVGLIVVLYAVFRLPITEPATGDKNLFRYWFVSVIIVGLIVIIRIFIGLPFKHVMDLARQALTSKFYATFFNHPSIVDLAMTIISAFILSFIITPFVIGEKQ